MVRIKMKNINYKEFLDDLKNPEITDMNNPNCINCNECCSIITILTPQDYKNLKKYFKTKEGKAKYKQAIKRNNKYKNTDTISMMCPFLTKNKRCSIYSNRPKLCMDFHCSEDLRAKDYDIKSNSDNKHYVINDLF